MIGFLFPGRNPLLYRKQSFLCLSRQQLWLVWINYKKVKEIKEAAVEFDHFYYCTVLVQCKQGGLNISGETAHLQRCHRNQENSNFKCLLEVKICMKNFMWKVLCIQLHLEDKNCVFCGYTFLNLLSVRLSIIGCQSYFLSINWFAPKSSNAVPSRFYKFEICHISPSKLHTFF